ncbi:28S ribosomal protein S10, mitochondrial [Scaptodrosophila lebanonensis]|uniref:Small ribosomal subunit protein uS10m n=1 Tax=Drosophila lebanonensis TaxID=7225 RepID=A0A6J2TIM9_DROLE|nr:28S ribosomal protein S10, mitochondrial [Scaptodrosophila lebanonensis]
MLQLWKTLRGSQLAPAVRAFSALSATSAPGKVDVEPIPASELDKLYSKLEIELRGVDPAVLKSYTWFANTAAGHLGIETGKCWAPRKAHHDRLTLLKSVHIYKKHRAQYEVRTYFYYLTYHKLTGSTMDTFLEYIERNLPEGVALQASKTELQQIPEHLSKPPEQV